MLLRLGVLALCSLVGFVSVPSAKAHVEGTYVPGLTPASVIAHFEDFGLTCINDGQPNGGDPGPGQRGAECSATFPEHGAQVSVLLNYFDDGHVESVWTTVFEQDVGVPGTVDPDFAFEWTDHVAELPYTGNEPEATKAWVRERAASGECHQGCSLDVDIAVWFMAARADGLPGQLDLNGTAVVAAPSASPMLPNTAVPLP